MRGESEFQERSFNKGATNEIPYKRLKIGRKWEGVVDII